MGCHTSKQKAKESDYPTQADQSSLTAADIEDKIFALLKDSFCANGAEASLLGQMLKDEAMLKLTSRIKKSQEAQNELKEISTADYFVNRIALVDPMKGEIVVPYDRIINFCQRLEIDELHMLYERLRQVKVARLRETHGSDVVAIIDDMGDQTYSDCRDKSRYARSSAGTRDHQEQPQPETSYNQFDTRNLGI